MAVRGTDELAALSAAFNDMAASLQEKMAELEDLSQVQRQFVSDVSHELRTPLTSIRAAATTLLESSGLDEAGRQDLVSLIDEESARLDLLIGEAVEMAEIDADSVRVKMSQFPPRTLLDEAVEQARKALAAHRVAIKIDDPDEANRPAWFDPNLLGRVLRHLLENAAAHTPAGSHVTLSSRRVDGRLEFGVADDGPGIDPRDLPLIFQRFYRGKHRNSTRKGSGMGLAICRAILIVHGGGIEATSAPGEGATFRFWVPLVEKEPGSSA
jgi:two-component system sensor histidine kinase KdpD